jgi:LacI family transcriptional regulator
MYCEVTMAVRMKDIAAELGISTVAVSKAYNNHRDVSAATRERVLRRMKELNYQPNLHAQGLVSGQTYIVGLVVPDLVHAFFSEVAKSISDVLRQKGFGLVISSSDEDPELEKQEIEQMIRRRVDVLIVASCQSNADSFLSVVEQKVPLILLDRRFDAFKANFVGTDDILVGQLATEHLIDIGRKRIAHIGGQNISTSTGRAKGYKKALQRHKIRVPNGYIVSRRRADESGDITGKEAMDRLLTLRPRPDAVFCYNDPAAIGAMKSIIQAGLRIPEDIALIGAGNIRYAESLRVPLSTIDVSSKLIGEHVGKLSLKLAGATKKIKLKSIFIEPKVIVRASSRL